MTELTGLIGAVNSTVTLAKGLYEISKEYDNSVLIRQISELNLQLAQVQNEAAKMMEELRDLKAEADEQEKNPLTYNSAVYIGKDNFPYCPACYDNQRKRIHVHKLPNHSSFFCPVCRNSFADKDDKSPKIKTPHMLSNAELAKRGFTL